MENMEPNEAEQLLLSNSIFFIHFNSHNVICQRYEIDELSRGQLHLITKCDAVTLR